MNFSIHYHTYIHHVNKEIYFILFLGRYEWPPSAYKDVYFNATPTTFKIWIVILLGILGLYETLRYIFDMVWTKKLRFIMLAVLISALYPHYYGWWGLFNYLNEGYHGQWGHQIFFSFTEVLSTAMVVHLCNKENRMESWKLLLILNINLMHIIVGSMDQFVNNIMYREGKAFEVVRDMALMMPDIFHCLVPFFELQSLAEKRSVPLYKLFYREELMMFGVTLILMSLFGKVI